MRTPIERMIDSVVSCTICGQKGIGQCNCWIKLRCPKCKKTMGAPREEDDVSGTVIVEVICPDCDDGDFHEARYFDVNGKLIG